MQRTMLKVGFVAITLLVIPIFIEYGRGKGLANSACSAHEALQSNRLKEMKTLNEELHARVKFLEEAAASKNPAPAWASNQPFHITVCVFTYRRLPGLHRLMASLKNARYGGHRVDMAVFFDDLKKGQTADETAGYVRAFHWPHGELRIHRREANAGLKKNILEAWYPTQQDEEGRFAVFFEDDIEASPLWYVWAGNAIRQYYKKDERLIGVSLYRPIHEELSHTTLQLAVPGEPFLFQQPCSWGALYFPRGWRKFRDWYHDEGRMQDGATTSHGAPWVGSNGWGSEASWKKYLITYMWDHGLFMVYPNTPNNTVLSTNHLMKGEHKTPSRKLFELPILTQEAYDAAQQQGVDLLHTPPLEDLKAYDLVGRPVGSYRQIPQYNEPW